MKILNYNIYGPPLAANRNERTKIIIKEIVKFKPEVIMLQELIMPAGWQIVSRVLAKKGYFINQSRKLMGFGGSIIATKNQPNNKSTFVKYINQGSLLTFWENLLPKGYRYLNYKDIVFINTQLICIYRYKKREIAVHSNQLEQLARFVNSIPRENKLILAGDFNREPHSPEMKKFMKHTKLENLLPGNVHTHNPENLEWSLKVLNKASNNNFFNPQKSFGTKQVDYMFCRGFEENTMSQKLIFDTSYEIKGAQQYLSDHYGILTEIDI